MERIISISTVAYDGHPLFEALDHLKRIGISHVELAFIEGYTDEYNESIFTLQYARTLRNRLHDLGLLCRALSAHMDLGSDEAVVRFGRRMEFAAEVGAAVILTNAAPGNEEKKFFSNIKPITAKAETLNLVVALENPGDGKDNLINTGKEGAELIKRINSHRIRLNYDFGNLISHLFEKVRPEDDFKHAVSCCAHLHMKDVKAGEEGWFFPPVGSGDIDYRMIIRDLIPQDLSFSLEVPTRLRRRKDASPYRISPPPDIAEVDEALKASLAFVRRNLSSSQSF